MQFWQTCWVFFATRPKNYSLDVQKRRKKWEFYQKKFLPKVFLWTLRLQFLQRRPPKKRLMSEKGRIKTFFRKKVFSPKMFPRSRTMQFSQFCRQFLSRRPKVFRSLPEIERKKGYLQNVLSFFMQNAAIILCIRGLHFYSLVKNFLPDGRNLFVQYPKLTK